MREFLGWLRKETFVDELKACHRWRVIQTAVEVQLRLHTVWISWVDFFFSVTVFVNGENVWVILIPSGKEDLEVEICLFQPFCF